MPFCPECGVAERAAEGELADRPLGHRRVLGALAGGLALFTVALFTVALFTVALFTVALFTVALVAVALEVPPTPPRPCTALDCLAPA